MKFFAAFMILISVQSHALEYNPKLIQCEKPKINLSKMIDVLESVKRDQLAASIVQLNNRQILPVNDVTQVVKEQFEKIQKEIFGFQPVKLEFNTDYSFGMNDDNNTLTAGIKFASDILTNQNYKNGKSLLAMIIAHEFGHIVQNLTVIASEPTVNGYVHDSLDEKTKSQLIKAVIRKRELKTINLLIENAIFENLYVYTHLEVDVFALLVLKKMGIALPEQSDFELLFKTIATERSKKDVLPEYAIQDKYESDAQRCGDKVRIEYLKQFRVESKNILFRNTR